MTFEIHVHVHYDGNDILSRLTAIEAQGEQIMATTKELVDSLTAKLNDLQAEVAAETDVTAAAVTLIEGLAAQGSDLKQQLKDLQDQVAAGGDPAVVAALQQAVDTATAQNDALMAAKDKLAAAVVANTSNG